MAQKAVKVSEETTVWVTAQFIALHRWPAAPHPVKFLANFHRHVFRVRVEVSVTDGDRQVEFLQFQSIIQEHLKRYSDVAASQYDFWSCEKFARDIANAVVGYSSFPLSFISVTVSEDGENGATVTRRASSC